MLASSIPGVTVPVVYPPAVPNLACPAPPLEAFAAAEAAAEALAASTSALGSPLPELLPAAEQQAEALQLSLWQWYCRALEQWPLLSRVATGVVGTITSDLLAQLLEGRHSKDGQMRAMYDAPRTARLVLYSAIIGTPLAHFWFQYLDTVGHSEQQHVHEMKQL